MKKDYMKPTMKVVMLKQRYHMLVGSGGGSKGASSASGEGLKWVTDGLGDDDDDV